MELLRNTETVCISYQWDLQVFKASNGLVFNTLWDVDLIQSPEQPCA